MKKILYTLIFLAAGTLAFPKTADAALEQARYAVEDEYCVNDDCTRTGGGGGGGGGTSSSNTCNTVMMTMDGTFSSSSSCNAICSVSCKTCTQNGVTKYYCAPPTGGSGSTTIGDRELIGDATLLDNPIELSCSIANCQTCNTRQTACTVCNKGYVPKNGSCVACAAGTYSSAGASSCKACDSTMWSGTGASSCAPCAMFSEFSVGGYGSCTTCSSSGCTSASCNSGYTWDSSSRTCKASSTCSLGYFMPTAGYCQKCPKGPYCPDPTASAPTSCPSGTATEVEGATSSSQCKTSTSTSTSSGCPGNTTLYSSSPGTCATTLSCKDSSGSTKYYCSGCKDGYTFTTSPMDCSPMTCPSGKTLLASKPANCSSYNACVSSGSVKYYCNQCDTGYTWNSSTNSCQLVTTESIGNCPTEVATYSSCPSQCSGCLKCNSSGSTKYMCTSCIEGYILNSCGAGQASVCTPQNCGAGKYLDGSSCTGSCKTCPAGSSCNGTVKSQCPAGTYSAEGASSCTKCPAGTYSSSAGATSSSACKACASGTGSVAGSSSCYSFSDKCKSLCGSNYSYSRTGSLTADNGNQEQVCTWYPLSCEQSCTTGWDINKLVSGTEFTCQKAIQDAGCPAGQYKKNGSCEKCPAGTYQSEDDYTGTSCTPCQSGATNTTAGSTSCDMCMRVYPLDHLGMCTACDPTACTAGACGEEGYEWSDSAHNCVSSGCKAGFYKSGDTCSACPSMTYQPEDDYRGTTCTDCPAGYGSILYYGNGPKSCTKCTIDHGTVVECRPSGTRLFNNKVNCDPGYALRFEFGEIYCLQCGPGSYSPGGVGDYDTKSGNYAIAYSQGPMGSTCPYLCPKGTYNKLSGQKSSSACLKCEAGTYASEEGSMECLECEYGTYSKAGASSCFSCASEYKVTNGTCMNCNDTKCTEIACKDGYTLLDGACYSEERYCEINFPIPNGKCTACGDTECSKAECNSPELVFAGQIDWPMGCMCKQDGYAYNKVTGKCEPSNCEPGYYLSGGSCVKCEKGYACPDGVSKVVCAAGTASEGEGAIECHFCSASGTYSKAGSNVCLACGPGKMDVSHGSCVDCAEGTMCTTTCAEGEGCIESTWQALCSPGYFSKAGAASCATCGYGYYCPDGKASTRKACPSNTWTKTDYSSSESDCLKASDLPIENGTCTAVSLDGKCTAATCKEGGYVWNPTTAQCDMGCSFANGSCSKFDSATCTCKTVGACNPGYVADTDPTTSGSYICRKSCDEGMYIDPAKLGCVKEDTQTSCTGAEACEICPAGYACAGGKANKVECAAGTYSRENAKVCSACTEITLYDEDMSVSGTCASCSKAYGYCEVTKCNDDTRPVLTGAGENDFTCYKCPQISISAELQSTIGGVASMTGSYSNGAEMISDKTATEQVSCKSCILDAQVENGYCLNCSYVGGKAVCNTTLEGAILCNPGYQVSASGTCEACPSGTFKQGYNADSCTSCSDYIQTNGISYADITTTENIAATEAQVATANRISAGYITRVKVGSNYVSTGASNFSQCRLNADALDLVTCKEPLQRSENSCCCVKP